MTARAVPESEERYQAFVQNSHEGIWRFEVDEPIPTDLKPAEQIDLMYQRAYLAEANNAMAAMYGVESVDALIGTRMPDLLVRSDPRNTAYLEAFIASGYALSGVDSHEVDYAGNHKVFRNSLIGIVKDGMLVRAWGTQQDVTNQYEAEAAVRKSEERLALALKASRMGTWEWDIRTKELTWSNELKALFGLKPDDDISYEKYKAMLHPDERRAIKQIIRAATKDGKEYRMEHRVIWPDGSVHWLLGQGKVVSEGDKPVRMIGTSMNIDDIKHVKELEAINTALKNQQEQLLALNTSKDEFITLASHQLRTPATAVKQYIGMLLQGFRGTFTEDQQAFLQIAYESNERQLHVINDLLKVARLDAGKVLLAKKRTNVLDLVDDVVEEQFSSFRASGQRVLFDRPRRAVYASVDAPRLHMVLENILDNARKYSPAGSTTNIRLQSRPHQVVVTVTDEGVGIAKKDIKKLFQKFSRIENALSLHIGGTGIGLYWAKKIMDLHGGTIEVESKPRRGSVFRITIPR